MKIILSDELTSKDKERFINALYELTPKLPIFVNYMKPITDIVTAESYDEKGGIQKSVYIKVIGDDIYNVNKETEKKLLDSLKGTLSKKFLFNYWKTRGFNTNQRDGIFNVEVIDNFDMEDLSLLEEHVSDKLVYIYKSKELEKTTKTQQFKIESFNYDDVKNSLEELLLEKQETEITMLELATKKLEDCKFEHQKVVMEEEVQEEAQEIAEEPVPEEIGHDRPLDWSITSSGAVRGNAIFDEDDNMHFQL